MSYQPIGDIYANGICYYKSDMPNSLKPFLNYTFSSGGSIGKDFVSFNTKFRNFIKSQLPEEWKIVKWHRGHYYCSAFLKNANNQYVYIAIDDVRFFMNEWATHILYRTAKDEEDYRGGFNQYTDIFTFRKAIRELYN